MTDTTVRVPDPEQSSLERIGAIVIALAAIFIFLAAFRFVFNCVCIDFLILRDFSICTKMKVQICRICCRRDVSVSSDESNDAPTTERDLESQNTFHKLPFYRRKELFEKHMLSGFVTREKLVEWKSGSDSEEKSNSVTSNDEFICPICLTEMVPGEEYSQSKLCTHVFHKDCIFSWLGQHLTCPCCRQVQYQLHDN